MSLLQPPAQVQPLSVSQLTNRVKQTLESDFSSVWVEGEISGLSRPSSGHIYLSLKDSQSLVKCALYRGVAYRLRFEPRDGMAVVTRGRLSVYNPRGEYQLAIEEIYPKGVGALELAYRQLFEKLKGLGYFDASRKRPVNKFPKHIAIVTSPNGAGLRDMLEILSRRWPIAQVTLFPTLVQGEGAAQQISQAIQLANRLHHHGYVSFDYVIVGRGGGSLEDLWPFNEQIVAEAIFASYLPVISAVGHEIDVTISDHVADVRALTPSHAVTENTPDVQQLLSSLGECHFRMTEAVHKKITLYRVQVNRLAQARIFRQPLSLIRDSERRLDDLQRALQKAIEAKVNLFRTQLQGIAGQLESLSPLAVLSRGYSLTQKLDGEIISESAQLGVGDVVRTRFHQGSVTSRVEKIDG